MGHLLRFLVLLCADGGIVFFPPGLSCNRNGQYSCLRCKVWYMFYSTHTRLCDMTCLFSLCASAVYCHCCVSVICTVNVIGIDITSLVSWCKKGQMPALLLLPHTRSCDRMTCRGYSFASVSDLQQSFTHLVLFFFKKCFEEKQDCSHVFKIVQGRQLLHHFERKYV